MPKDQLTDADMAEHRVSFRRPGYAPKTIRAAYIAADEKHPDMLVFKDSDHRVVYMISREEALDVQRMERSEHPAEITEGGFNPTSQVMKGMPPELRDPRTDREIMESPVYPPRLGDFG